MKTSCLVLVFSLLAAVGQAQPPAARITLLAEASPEDPIALYYQNAFQDLLRPRFRPDSLTGKWQPLLLAATHPLLLKLSAPGGQQFAFYARPGDTVTIRTHPGQDPYYSFHDPRQRPARQAALNFFSVLHQQGLGMGYPDAMGLTPGRPRAGQAPRFCTTLDQRLAFLHQQQAAQSLDPAFVTFATGQLRAQYYQALFGDHWDAQHRFTQYPPAYLTELAAAPVPAFLTDSDLLLASDLYRTVAVSYVRYLSRDVLDTPDELPMAYAQTTATLRGATRDFVWFLLLKSHLAKGHPAFAPLQSQFRRACSTPRYVRYVDSVAQRAATLALRVDLLNTPMRSATGETLTWAQVVAQNRGHVVYVDLWASWCGPCLAEMPASHRLPAALPGQAVRVLYVSVDSDATKWQQARTKQALDQPGTQHYLLDPSSALAQFFQAPPVPRYLLLDRQGQVVSLDAPRPSSPTIGQVLAAVP